MNQVAAYLKTYPKSSYDAARANSSRLIANDNVQAEIQARLNELKVSADEVLVRLADQARGSMGDFLKFYDGVNTPFLDLQAAKEKGLLHLVKKLKYNKDGQPEIELYDAQAALVQLGRHHKLFTDNAEMNITLAKRIEFFEVDPLEPEQPEQGDNAE